MASVQAAASGNLAVSATVADDVPLAANTLQVQLWDPTGHDLLAAGSDVRNAAGKLNNEDATASVSGMSHMNRLGEPADRCRQGNCWPSSLGVGGVRCTRGEQERHRQPE